MTTQDDINEINGPDPLDEAFDKYQVTADALIGDTWKIRNKFNQLAKNIMIRMAGTSDNLTFDDYEGMLTNLMKLRDKIEDTDREFRRLKGMHAREPEKVGKYTLIIEDSKE